MQITGAGDMLHAFKGVTARNEPIRIQRRPAPGVSNAIVCDTVRSLTEEHLVKLPFWLFGAYQELFFGRNYESSNFIMTYLNALFKSTLKTEFEGKSVEDVMAYLRTYNVPHEEEYTNNKWNITDATGNNINSLIKLVESDYVNRAISDRKFDEFEFTKRNVPYFLLWKRPASESSNFMLNFKVPFDLYYLYFRNLLLHFILSEGRFDNVKLVQVFADGDAKNILDVNINGSTDEESVKIYTKHRTYLRCHPTKEYIKIAMLDIYDPSGIAWDTSFLDPVGEGFLLNCIVYSRDHPFGKPPADILYVDEMKKIIKRNKLEILAILLGEVEIPDTTAEEKAAFMTLQSEIVGSNRSNVFLTLFYLFNLEYD